MALSPWPTDTAEVTAAVARIQREAAGRAMRDADGAAHLGQVAAALVEREAPAAPEAIKDEAVIRFAGYLAQADFATLRQETIGPLTREHVTNHGPAFRNCGAKGLLSPWKARRAGAI